MSPVLSSRLILPRGWKAWLLLAFVHVPPPLPLIEPHSVETKEVWMDEAHGGGAEAELQAELMAR